MAKVTSSSNPTPRIRASCWARGRWCRLSYRRMALRHSLSEIDIVEYVYYNTLEDIRRKRCGAELFQLEYWYFLWRCRLIRKRMNRAMKLNLIGISRSSHPIWVVLALIFGIFWEELRVQIILSFIYCFLPFTQVLSFLSISANA